MAASSDSPRRSGSEDAFFLTEYIPGDPLGDAYGS